MIVLHSRKSDGYLSAGALLAGIVTFIVYVPVLKNGFVGLDDEWYITNNPYITRLNADFFRWAFSEFYAKNWHPLTWLSHAIDYAIYGLNPSGHHFTSVVFHGIASMGVVSLSFRIITYSQLVTDIGYKFDRMQTLLAAVVSGIIFGIHPLHVESVAWVSERKDVLSGFLYIFSVIFYLKYAEDIKTFHGAHRRSYLLDKWYLLSLVSFLFALLSKPMAVSLPIVLLLLDIFPLCRLNKLTWRAVCIEKIPFFFLSFEIALTTILAQRAEGIKTLVEFPFLWRVINSFHSLIVYIVKFICPVGLSPFYPFPDSKSLFSSEYTFTVVAAAAVTAIAVILFRKGRKAPLVVWMYYIITLSPVLDIVKVGTHAFADRYMYLPSIGFCLMLGIVVSRFFAAGNTEKRSFRAVSIILLGVIIMSLIFITKSQITVWKDSITMWNRVVDITESNGQTSKYAYFGYFGRGTALASQKRYEESVRDLNRAVKLNPSMPDIYLILGNVYLEQKRYETAIGIYLSGLRIYPYHVLMRNFLSVAYINIGNMDDAYRELAIALKLSPNSHLSKINF